MRLTQSILGPIRVQELGNLVCYHTLAVLQIASARISARDARMHVQAGFWRHLWLVNLCAAHRHLSRRAVLAAPPAAAAGLIAQPHAAAAAAKKAATTTPTPRSAALDAAGYAYALVRANDGGQVVTLDLDRTQRVRSAVYFYETRAQADAVRKAVMSARPKAAPLALARTSA